jgi:nitroreductase
MLRAHEMGLGTVIVGAYDTKNAKSILKLEDKYEIGAIIPVGRRPDVEIKAPKRREIEDMFRVL